MLDDTLVVAGACLGFVGNIGYAVAAWRGSIVPNRVTWTLWAVIPLVIFAASLSRGADLQSLFALAAGLGPAIVIAAVLVGHRASFWKVSRLDVGCLVLSLFAIALWVATRNGEYAIALSLLADATAALPTIIKSYRDPATESAGVFSLYTLGSALVLVATPHWTTAKVAFALYAAILYALLTSLILVRRATSGGRAAASGATNAS